jgi:hypothetical protein
MKRKVLTLCLVITLVSASLFATASWSQLGFGVGNYNDAFVEQVEYSGQVNSRKIPIGIGGYVAAGTDIGTYDNIKLSAYSYVGLVKDFGNGSFYTALMVGPGTEFVLKGDEAHFDFTLGAFLTAEYCINEAMAIYLSGSYTHAILDTEGVAMPDRDGFNAGIGFGFSFSKWGVDDPSIFIPY